MKKTTILLITCIVTFIFQTNAQDGGIDCESALSLESGNTIQTTLGDDSQQWYSFTPTEDGAIDISSCLGGGDTVVSLYNECIGIPLISNDDACPFLPDGTGDAYASEITNVGVAAGTTYYIEWQDTWSSNTFTWSLTFTPGTGTPICEQVGNIVLSNPTETTIDVSWDETDYAEQGYLVEIYEAGDTSFVIAGSDDYIASPPYLDTLGNLVEGTDYDLYVITVCDLNEGLISYSSPVTFTAGTLGVSSFETITFSVAPNPANGLVTISTDSTIENVEIYNILGQKVLQNSPISNEFTLDIRNLRKGTYFVSATSNGITTTKKLLVI